MIPARVSETLLKKYSLNQKDTQLTPWMYTSGFSTLKLGPAPAFAYCSYHLESSWTSLIGIDHIKFGKHVKSKGKIKQPEFIKLEFKNKTAVNKINKPNLDFTSREFRLILFSNLKYKYGINIA